MFSNRVVSPREAVTQCASTASISRQSRRCPDHAGVVVGSDDLRHIIIRSTLYQHMNFYARDLICSVLCDRPV